MHLPKPTSTLPNLSFFGDSSSRDSAFMVAGGFAVAGERIPEIEDEVKRRRDAAGIRSEFHWKTYRGGARKSAYEDLVEYAFSLIEQRKAALHLIIAQFHGYDHKRAPNENRDTSVNRMYYQLALHRMCRFYGKKRAIHLRLDSGNDCADIIGMRNQLCADAYSQHNAMPNCVRSIEAMDSMRSGIVQMADVIVGAVAAKRNGRTFASAKGDLCEHMLKTSKHSDWACNTHYTERFFTVWNHKSKSVPRSPRPC